MKLPEPQTRTFISLIADIEKGQIKIPQFQRDFVWTMQKSAGIIDSIIKGYPIGTFIFWRTKERLRAVKNIGKQELPDLDENENIDFVLDGQQRLTSVYACLKGSQVERADSDRVDDFSAIYIDLEAKDHDQIVKTDISDLPERSYIRILDLLSGGLTLLASYPIKYHTKIQEYKNHIESYQYSIIQIKEATIDVATEIFTRINVGGKPLSLFEIMVAKTFDHAAAFDLHEKFEELIERLRPHNYETISDATVLQLISLILAKDCKRQTILNLKKRDFIAVWAKAIDSIERSIEYFRNCFRIPVSQLLPYNALVVPFAYFFYHHPDKPTDERKEYLEDFFWRCSLGGRYSSSLESRLAQDIKKIDAILKNKLPVYEWAIDTSSEFIIQNGAFSAGRSYIKAILCLYAYHQPKSFVDNSVVNINNYWLKQANSRNYHHFFPKAYLKSTNEEEFYINHILNITIVDDYLNKREIGAQAPAKYMKKFSKTNKVLAATMMTHLISDLEKFGVWENDYDRFFAARAKVVSRELSKRVMKQKIDEKGQEALPAEDEEESLSAIDS